MPNTLTAIMPKILARALINLREMCMMPRLVNSDWSAEVAKPGSTIDVPVPTAQAVTAITPSNTPPAPAARTPTTVQIILDQWNKTEFFLTDKELGEIDKNQAYYPMQLGAAVRAMANQVNADIFANYKQVYGYTGTAGTTPFAIGSGNFAAPPTAATNLRKVLNQQVCPLNDRRCVLDFAAGANALSLPAFANVAEAGDAGPKIQGSMGRKFGLDWYEDDIVPTHTTGAAGTPLLDDTVARAVGIKTLHMDGYTTKPSVGDVFTIAGDTQTYVVTASTTLVGTDSDISFEPGLKVAIPAADGNEAVTFKASHVVNLGFHRDAFAFANRPVGDLSLFKGGSEIVSLTDSVTGISMTLELSRQHHQTVWELSMLYGSKLVRPELVARLAG